MCNLKSIIELPFQRVSDECVRSSEAVSHGKSVFPHFIFSSLVVVFTRCVLGFYSCFIMRTMKERIVCVRVCGVFDVTEWCVRSAALPTAHHRCLYIWFSFISRERAGQTWLFGLWLSLCCSALFAHSTHSGYATANQRVANQPVSRKEEANKEESTAAAAAKE